MRRTAVLLAALTFGACGGPPPPAASPTPTTSPDDGSALVDAARSAGRLLGAAVNHSPLAAEPEYAATLARHFDYVTPEYEMKWDPIQAGGRTSFDFSAADAIVDFATAHGLKVKGHALVWHGAVPAWANDVPDAEFPRVVEDYIATVAGRYRGRVIAWDVVNEAVADDGHSLRDSIFLRKLGPRYIADAFRAARAKDPDALLFYNDYGAEGTGAKADRVYALVQDLRAQGVPIDGVGLQMHIAASGFPDPKDIEANLRRLTDLGLLVNLSEMDVRIRDVPGTPADRLEKQRHVYHDVAGACLAVPRCHAITLWGFTDKYSWIDAFFGADDPLVFDEVYRKKPAYFGLEDALLGR